MNCPSRTDEDDILKHPEWNQCPPYLAADLTPRAQLNGRVNWTANSRSARDQGQLARLAAIKGALVTSISSPPDPNRMARAGWGGGEAGWSSSAGKTLVAGLATLRLWAHDGHQSLSWNRLWTVINMVVTGYLIHQWASPMALVFGHTEQPGRKDGDLYQATRKRQSTCASAGVKGDHRLGLHVGALFIILFVSSSACAFPMMVLRFPRLRIPSTFLFSARHFGTGVLIATAFCHLLPTAFISLTDPCLPLFWTTKYPAMPGAIALAAVFFLVVIEMVLSPARHMCGGELILPRPRDQRRMTMSSQETSVSQVPELAPTTDRVLPPGHNRNIGPIHGRPSSVARSISRMERRNNIEELREERGQELPLAQQDTPDNKEETAQPEMEEVQLEVRHVTISEPSAEQQRKKAILQCVLLEVGILFHSVFIGMALSVSSGGDFVALLIAISFHQTFEGLALGSRIAEIDWPKEALQPWFMAFTYGCTTPLGQAIGLATRNLYSPGSTEGLLMVGIMNAISSGLLIHASLVELLSEDFLSERSWRILRGRRRVGACFLVFAGAFGMSLVGAWA